MRFQFEEIVEHPDADLALRILEHCFRDVSLEVIHTEDQLTIYGLGPSFRTMNRNDKTVLWATRQQNATLLQGEANFLASALMGDMPQDTVVRSKIEQAVRCMKTQLHLDAVHRTLHPPNLYPNKAPSPLLTRPSAPFVSMPEASASSSREPLELEQISFESAQPAAMEPFAEPPTIEPEESFAIEANDPVTPVPPVFTAVAPISPPVPELPYKSKTPAPRPPLQSFLSAEASPTRRKRSITFPLTLLAVLLVLSAAYLLQHRNLTDNLFTLVDSRQHAAPIADSSAAKASTSSIPATVSQLSSPAPQPVQAATAAGPEDIKTWIEEWAAAMGTSDPEAQVSFYTDPVDRYFLAPNVGRKELLREKQSDIESRNGVWTFKAEDVVIERQTESSAVVLLTKHATIKSPSSSLTRQQRIKTQLKLKLVDGNWKIISERALGWG